jgi:Tol biopolymer transport system component
MNAIRRPVLLSLTLLLAACSTAPAEPDGSLSQPSAGASAAPSTTVEPSASAEAPLPGGQLAFLRDGELVILDMSSGTETATGILDVLPLAFTLDHRELIGLRLIAGDVYNVVLVRQPVDGGEATVLMESLPNYGAPAASPDGRYLAFGSDGVAPNGLVVVDLDTGEASRLTADGGNSPVWSPNSRSIAYTRAAGTEGHDLFIVDVATAATRQLTADEWEDSPLRWTEDGTAVLTTSHRGGDGTRLAITVWQVDTTDGALTERPDFEFAVASFALSSPDGRYVARLSPQNILSLTEGELRVGNRLESTDPSVHLTWSPNSAWLVWTSWDENGGAHDLYLVHAPDGEPIRLTRTAEGESHPVWGPVRHGF